jgi:ribosomal protein S26
MDKMDNKSRKLDLLNNTHYAKTLCIMALGNNTYKSLREYRHKLERKDLAPPVINAQFKLLMESQILHSDNIKRKYNKKRFCINWNLLFDILRKYVNAEYKKTSDEWQSMGKPYIRKRMKDKGFSDTITDRFSNEAKYPFKELPEFSDEFRGFLRIQFLEQLKGLEFYHINKFLAMSLKDHFDLMIKNYVRVYLEVFQREINQEGLQNAEMESFFLLCHSIIFPTLSKFTMPMLQIAMLEATKNIEIT